MGIADLFRPKYRHSNVEVRAEAVRQLGTDGPDVAIAINIARKDSEASIRRLAIEKIEDPDVLVDLAAGEGDRSVRQLAHQRAAAIWVTHAVTAEEADDGASVVASLVSLGDQSAIAEVASRAALIEVRDAALAHLDDAKALAELARSSNTHMAARKAAIARIDDEDVLRSIAVDEKRKDVAMAASERLESDEALEVVATKAKNKAVRTRARKRLNERHKQDAAKESEASAESKRRHAELVQLVSTAESRAGADDLNVHEAEMDQVKRAYAALGAANDALNQRFERAVTRFDKRLASYKARNAARLAALAEEERAAAEKAAAEKAAAEEAAAEEAVADGADAGAEDAQTSDDGDGAAAEPGEASAEASGEASAGEASGEASAGEEDDEEKRRQDREKKKEERRQRALESLQELVAEVREGMTLDKRRAAEKLLQKADKTFDGLHLGHRDDEPVVAFKEARHALFLRVQELREADGWQQWANISRQEALIAQAKTLLEDESQQNLGKQLKDLQAAWKAVGPAPRKKGQELWEIFKATCDQIYERVKVERARQSEVHAANLERKIALCERVEVLAESTDWEATANEIKDLQREWKTIGPVPRKKSDAVWKRFRGACDLFFERRKPFMELQMAEWENNLAKKQEMCEQAEALAESTDWQETSAKLRQMQRDWRDVGLVPRKDAKAINNRFRAACDLFFNRRKEFHEQQKRERQQALDDLRTEIDTLAQLASGDAGTADGGESGDGALGEGAGIDTLVARTLAVRASLRDLAPEGQAKRSLYAQANTMFRAMLEWYRDHFEGTELDPGASLYKKQKLLAKAEKLAPPPQEEAAAESAEPSSPEEMAKRLREALAQNAMNTSLAQSTEGKNLADKVEDLQDAWQVIGPIPGLDGQELEDRFQSACDRALRSAGQAG